MTARYAYLGPEGTFTEAALECVRELAEETITEEALVEMSKKEATKLAGRALQEAPDYLRGLLSWRDQVKRGKFTLYLDTSSLNRQVDTLRSIASMLVVWRASRSTTPRASSGRW